MRCHREKSSVANRRFHPLNWYLVRPLDFSLFYLLWLASWTTLEAMKQAFPPRPALFLRLMLILPPSRVSQLFPDLWVTHPIATGPLPPDCSRCCQGQQADYAPQVV